MFVSELGKYQFSHFFLIDRLPHCHFHFVKVNICDFIMGNILKYLYEGINKYRFSLQLNSAIKYLQYLGEGSVDLELNKSTGIATILINNPKKKNAISGKMMVDFYHVISELENWTDGKAVILRGVGDCFCSGGDLDVFKIIAENGRTAEMSFFMSYAMKKLTNLSLITVAYISGRGAFGGGAEIALTTDFCVIHPDSKIAFIHATMGVTPAWDGGFRLRERMGVKGALDILLQSRSKKANDALELGLVDGVCNNIDEVETFMAEKLRHDAIIVKSIKKTILANDPSVSIALFAQLLGAESNKKALEAKLKHT